MTKLRIMSDLHLEFGALELEPIGEDILILAGDIGLNVEGAIWARKYSERYGIHTVMIAGNHEFYNSNDSSGVNPWYSVTLTCEELSAQGDQSKTFHFLDNSWELVKGVAFVGSTLWTDFNLLGSNDVAKKLASSYMNDYKKIYLSDGRTIEPDHTELVHSISKGFLEQHLGLPVYPYIDVVVTHHAPSHRSIHKQYETDLLSPCYASNLDSLVKSSKAKLWIHGHVHHSLDYMIGDTRVICNPRGYLDVETNPDFNPNLIIEI